MRRELSLAPGVPSPGGSRWHTAERCSWTKSVRWRCRCRPSCCSCCRTDSSAGSADSRIARWTSGSSAQQTGSWKPKSPRAISAGTFSTASTWSLSTCPPCASAAWIFPSWPTTFCRLTASGTTGPRVLSRVKFSSCCASTPGRETSANWKTVWRGTSSSVRKKPSTTSFHKSESAQSPLKSPKTVRSHSNASPSKPYARWNEASFSASYRPTTGTAARPRQC